MIRCRLRRAKLFMKSTLEPIKLEDGVNALIGKQHGQDNLKIQTLLFNTNAGKGKIWNLRDAKDWIKSHKQTLKERVFFDDIMEKAKEILLQEKVYSLPKKMTANDLNKSIEKLQRHFQKLPRRIKKEI